MTMEAKDMNETTESKERADISGRLDGVVVWNTGDPPADILLMLKCDDFMGEYTMKAKRVDYKKPKPGQSPKGFRKGWRWIKEDDCAVDRKEMPSAWAYI